MNWISAATGLGDFPQYILYKLLINGEVKLVNYLFRKAALLIVFIFAFIAFPAAGYCKEENTENLIIQYEEHTGEAGDEDSVKLEIENDEVDAVYEQGSPFETEGREEGDFYNETAPVEVEIEQEEVVYHRAKVLKVLKESENELGHSDESGIFSNIQLLEVIITKGPHKGEKLQAEYELNYGLDERYKFIPVTEGDEVLIYLHKNESGIIENAYVAEIARDKYLLYLLIGFVLILLVVGRAKGLKAVISLVLTVFGVLKILLPAILKGWDPVVVSVAVSVGIICITMFIISGFNKKTLSAIIGTTGGVIAAGIIALIIGLLAKLTGLGNEEAQMLMYVPSNVHFDFRGLLFAGIIIGTMGATMDVGMSIASAMHEIKENSPKIKTSDLFKAGMNVGRDTMATMSNTLILAYAGGSLHLMLLFAAYKIPFSNIINMDMIATEVLRAIAGSIGIIIAIPITALASAFIEENNKKEKEDIGLYYGQ